MEGVPELPIGGQGLLPLALAKDLGQGNPRIPSQGLQGFRSQVFPERGVKELGEHGWEGVFLPDFLEFPEFLRQGEELPGEVEKFLGMEGGEEGRKEEGHPLGSIPRGADRLQTSLEFLRLRGAKEGDGLVEDTGEALCPQDSRRLGQGVVRRAKEGDVAVFQGAQFPVLREGEPAFLDHGLDFLPHLQEGIVFVLTKTFV